MEATAQRLYRAAIVELSDNDRDTVVRRIEQGDPPGEPWSRNEALPGAAVPVA
ncbi:MAG: hypothetical protein ABR543_05795 [Gemmatimonadaceae bacterium]